jgi:hypothetical protein
MGAAGAACGWAADSKSRPPSEFARVLEHTIEGITPGGTGGVCSSV